MKKKMDQNSLPWYIISLMLTILGAISIIMLFVVHFYRVWGVVFWSIVISWSVILLVILFELGRLERKRRELMKVKDAKIAELEKALEDKN